MIKKIILILIGLWLPLGILTIAACLLPATPLMWSGYLWSAAALTITAFGCGRKVFYGAKRCGSRELCRYTLTAVGIAVLAVVMGSVCHWLVPVWGLWIIELAVLVIFIRKFAYKHCDQKNNKKRKRS